MGVLLAFQIFMLMYFEVYTSRMPMIGYVQARFRGQKVDPASAEQPRQGTSIAYHVWISHLDPQ